MSRELLFTMPFKRQYTGPLDADSYFLTESDLISYLTSPRRHPGQIVYCEENDKIFRLSKTKDSWSEVGPIEDNPPFTTNFTSVDWIEDGVDDYHMEIDALTHGQGTSKYITIFIYTVDNQIASTSFNVSDAGLITINSAVPFNGHLIATALSGSHLMSIIKSNTLGIQAWTPATEIALDVVVYNGNMLYRSTVDHISNVDINIDIASGKLTLLGGSPTEVSANEVDFSSVNFAATKVGDALDELFTSVSSGKTLIETAITDKGGEVSKVDDIPTFTELKNAIDILETGGGGTHELKSYDVVVTSVPTVFEYTLHGDLPFSETSPSVLKLTTNGTSQVLDLNFLNHDSVYFNENPNLIFDGALKVKNVWDSQTMTLLGQNGDEKIYASADISLDKEIISKINVDSNFNLYINAFNDFQIAETKLLTNLNLINNISSILINTIEDSGVVVRFMLDFGDGPVGYKSGTWRNINTTIKADIEANGMTKAEINALSQAIIETKRAGSTNFKLYIYMNLVDGTKNISILDAKVNAVMQSYYKLVTGSNFTVNHNIMMNKLIYSINETGTYKLNHIDAI